MGTTPAQPQSTKRRRVKQHCMDRFLAYYLVVGVTITILLVLILGL
jgi:hypothetical protein